MHLTFDHLAFRLWDFSQFQWLRQPWLTFDELRGQRFGRFSRLLLKRIDRNQAQMYETSKNETDAKCYT